MAHTVTDMSPNHGIVGDSVTITGTGFGASQGASTVAFAGTAVASYTSWADAQIVVLVPAATASGRVDVTVGGVVQADYKTSWFEVRDTTITALTSIRAQDQTSDSSPEDWRYADARDFNDVLHYLRHVETTTRGDVLARGAAVLGRIAVGAANAVFRSDGTDPGWGTLTALLDAIIGSTRGMMAVRGATVWQSLGIGAANTVVKSDATDPAWGTVTALLDALFSSSQGAILYRGASAWAALAPGASGNVLTTLGAGANPAWSSTAVGRRVSLYKNLGGSIGASATLFSSVGYTPGFLLCFGTDAQTTSSRWGLGYAGGTSTTADEQMTVRWATSAVLAATMDFCFAMDVGGGDGTWVCDSFTSTTVSVARSGVAVTWYNPIAILIEA